MRLSEPTSIGPLALVLSGFCRTSQCKIGQIESQMELAQAFQDDIVVTIRLELEMPTQSTLQVRYLEIRCCPDQTVNCPRICIGDEC